MSRLKQLKKTKGLYMAKSKKLILICLIGFLATACSSDPTRKDVESENNIASVKQRIFIHHQIGRIDQ